MSDLLHGPSFLASVDDRARIVGAGLLLLGVASLSTTPGVALGLALALVLLVLTRTCPRRTLRGLRPLLVLLVPLLLLTPLHAPAGSRPLVPEWTWGPTDLGAAAAGLVALRVIALGALAIALLGDLPVERTCVALARLGVPVALTHVALLAHRYAAGFGEDLTRIRWALAARGFRPRTDLETSRVLATVTGSLLLRSLHRTERVEQAMRCRGYAGRLVLEPAPPPRLLRDLLLLLAALGAAVGLHLLERGLP